MKEDQPVIDDARMRWMAEQYAGTVVGMPFHPPTRKADAREFAINAWLDGFRTALAIAQKERAGALWLMNC